MRYAICNEMFEDWDFAKICETASELGYTGLEVAPFTLATLITDVSVSARQAMRQTAESSGMQIIGLRYFNIFGSRQDPNGPYAAVIPLFVDKILKGEKVNIDGDGEQTRDSTYVDNAVQANIRAMLTDNEAAVNQVYNIAVGENFSVNYMYDLIQKYLNIFIEPNHREARKGDIRNSLADITKAKTLLGYDPQYRFEEGLKNTVEHFKVKFGY